MTESPASLLLYVGAITKYNKLREHKDSKKGTTEDEMVGRHHRLCGHGFGGTLGVSDGHGGLACCGSWRRKKSDTTERLN